MDPVDFPQSNKVFTHPPDLDGSQVMPVPAFVGHQQGGNMDGSPLIIVAWKPDEKELLKLIAGKPVFLCVVGNALPPHFLSVDIDESIV